IEQALGVLATQGWVTADSFEGLRALLVPQEKRLPFVHSDRKRRFKSVTSLEHVGRWSLLRNSDRSSRREEAQQQTPAAGGQRSGSLLTSDAVNTAEHVRDHAI